MAAKTTNELRYEMLKKVIQENRSKRLGVENPFVAYMEAINRVYLSAEIDEVLDVIIETEKKRAKGYIR